MSPLLNASNIKVIEAVNRRQHPWEIKSSDWFSVAEDVRELFGQIINTGKDNIALVPSVSYAMAIAAKNISLNPMQKILLLDQQYPSNVYAWQELSKISGAQIVTVMKPEDQNWTDEVLRILDESIGLVAVPNCHWTDGSLLNLEKISERTKIIGAKLVIDASQSVGAYPFDVQKVKPDFLVAAAYKWLLGPYGLAYLYVDKKYLQSGRPIEFSWLTKLGSEDFTKLVVYRDGYRPGARRFDAGGFPAFINLPIAIPALKQILEWGIKNIQQTLASLTSTIENEASLLKIETGRKVDRVDHLIGLRFTETQIACLSKLLPQQNIFVSFRGDKMRVAPYLYNTQDDINRLFETIKSARVL